MTTFEDLVGPGKKYSDADALAASRVHADDFIQQLTQEQELLRKELEERLSYEEFLTRMNSPRQPEDKPRTDNQPAVLPRTNDTAITPQDVERIVEQREQRTRYEANKQNTLSQYAEVNGPNHAQKLKQQATELGMSENDLQNLAGNNPKAFARLTGLDAPRTSNTFSAPPRNQMNTEAFLAQQPATNPLAAPFQDLYKNNKSEYWSPKTQNQIFKLVEEGKLSLDEIY